MNFLPDENDLPVLLSGSQETAGMDHVLYFIIDGHAEHDRRRPAQVSYAEGMFAYDGGNSEFSIDATAFHEAGHAVVGYALGLGCGGVSISWYSENTRTQIRRQGRDSILDRAGYVARAIWSLAGAAAEYKFGRVSHSGVDTFITGKKDRESIRLMGTGWTAEMAWREAQEALEVPPIWHAVEALAERMVDGLRNDDNEGAERDAFQLDGDDAETLMYASGVRLFMLGGWRYRIPEMPRLVRGYRAMEDLVEDIRYEAELNARP